MLGKVFSSQDKSCCNGLCVYPLCYYYYSPAASDLDQVALEILFNEMRKQQRAEAVLLELLTS